MNKDLLSDIENRMKILRAMIQKLRQNMLPEMLPGRLRISKDGAAHKYYHSLPDKQGELYIPVGEMSKIRYLAQKEYVRKALDMAESELSYLQKFVSHYPRKQFDDYYSSMSEPRRALVDPLWLPDDLYTQQWLEQKFKRLAFQSGDVTDFYTARGERVRSKSEMIIAEQLDKYGLPYLIEKPRYLKGFGWVYPDFAILKVRQREEVIWEHYGMMDDRNYLNERFMEKNKHYMANGYFPGINLLQTFETQKYPLGVKNIQMVIEKYLLD